MKILFFAQLKEQLGIDSVDVHISEQTTAKQLLQHLVKENPQWQAFLERDDLMCAVDQVMLSPQDIQNQPIANTQEVAFFPPVTGG
ncbi:molybdopterin converting factor subunit 1 [Bermanella marisrubri]|uniref:Molybdopterin synthase sulfur carrier subunit n=1 Tax=Bermanella marisrubri TaxID=207949 RepID=Q1MYT9_9GAMM|nr:molybdopterin converting factor subunit 1 [Bermanella marisrubri]EAT11117.1 molybdopterin biosynthesis [Oceanobacter sp. RED65] [Bermanella marisrubri]